MKIILCAINAKYPHTNPAVRSLKNAVKDDDAEIAVQEFTINMKTDDIVHALYEEQADAYGFSAYIWNIRIVRETAAILKTLMPHATMFVGGPEVSFDSDALLEHSDYIDYVIRGEGEGVFPDFIRVLAKKLDKEKCLSLTYRDGQAVRQTKKAAPVQMDKLAFAYDDIGRLKNRVLYYESSRGCPFGCTFCLSSTDHAYRQLPADRVKKDIDVFLAHGVMKVKFVDRTFNADKKRAKEILSYIVEKGGKTGFHFEIAGALLDEETVDILGRAEKGLIQLEIGVQSTNPETLKSIRRHSDFNDFRELVQKIIDKRNIHVHMDLIAGLPKQNMQTIKRSFDDVFFVRPDDLQLGFLKLLKGSGLRKNAAAFGISHTPDAPYEVLETPELSFGELRKLKEIAYLLKRLYNSGRFYYTVHYLAARLHSAFVLFEGLVQYIKTQYGDVQKVPVKRLERILYEYADLNHIGEFFADIFKYDYLNTKKKPEMPDYLENDEETRIEKNYFTEYTRQKRAEGVSGRVWKQRRLALFSMDILKYVKSGVIDQKQTGVLFDYQAQSCQTVSLG